MNQRERIVLTGVTGFGYHGVFAQERATGQEFIVDVDMLADARRAAAADDLAGTVDYGQVATAVHDAITGQPFALIERLADHIAHIVLTHPLVRQVSVTVHKPSAPITVPFADVAVTVTRDRLDARPEHPVPVVLALGSNIGDPLAHLRAAADALAATPGIDQLAVGSLVRSAAVGGPAQPDYLNSVIVASTSLSPRQVLWAAQGLEEAAGRVRDVRWGPRTLDVDVVSYGSVLATSADLDLPHPRAHQRDFVLVPWSQVQPDAVLAGVGGGPVAELAALCTPAVMEHARQWWPGGADIVWEPGSGLAVERDDGRGTAR